MKKIFRTFVTTLAIVSVGGVVGGYFYFKHNPRLVYQAIGCEASSHTYEKEMKEAMTHLLQENKRISAIVEQIYVDQKNKTQTPTTGNIQKNNQQTEKTETLSATGSALLPLR